AHWDPPAPRLRGPDSGKICAAWTATVPHFEPSASDCAGQGNSGDGLDPGWPIPYHPTSGPGAKGRHDKRIMCCAKVHARSTVRPENVQSAGNRPRTRVPVHRCFSCSCPNLNTQHRSESSRIMQSFFSALYSAYATLLFAVSATLTGVLILILPGLHLRRRVGATGMRTFCRLAGIRLRVLNQEVLPTGPAVVVANHMSYLDGLVFTAALPP